MPSPDQEGVVSPPPNLDDLRQRILAEAPPPAADPADFARVTREARLAISRGRVAPRGSEVRVRIAGAGVPGHDLPVHLAAQLLDALQGAITAVGSALHKSNKVKPPKDAAGKPLGIKKATELRLSSNIGAGSVVFFLEGTPEDLKGDELFTQGSDGLVDLAVSELFGVLATAQSDDADQIGKLTSDLQRLGAMTASKLNRLAERTAENELELDLGHWSPSGSRKSAVLARRGADAIKDAIERNRVRHVRQVLRGTLNTVSDGADMLRMTLDDDVTQRRLSVDPEIGVTLGSLLGKRVTAEVETTIRWKVASGRERRTYKLESAEESPEVAAD
jgi:hypothetical protein